jgi:hypothetical protein
VTADASARPRLGHRDVPFPAPVPHQQSRRKGGQVTPGKYVMFHSDRVNSGKGRCRWIVLVDLPPRRCQRPHVVTPPARISSTTQNLSLLIATTAGRDFSRGARPTPTDHLPTLALGTQTPNPLNPSQKLHNLSTAPGGRRPLPGLRLGGHKHPLTVLTTRGQHDGGGPTHPIGKLEADIPSHRRARPAPGRYTFDADATGYPRYLVPLLSRPALRLIPERGPPEALDCLRFRLCSSV